MKEALYLAFAEVIQDNSAYDSSDMAATERWLDASLVGHARYSFFESLFN